MRLLRFMQMGIRHFLRGFPKFPTASCFTRPSTEMYRAVEDGRLDCAIIGWPIEPKGSLTFRRIRNQIGAIVGSKRFFPELYKVRHSTQLESYPWIIYPREPEPEWSSLLDYHRGGYVVREFSTLRELVMSGHGIANVELGYFLPSDIRDLVRADLIYDMPDPASYLVFRKKNPAQIQALIDKLEESLREEGKKFTNALCGKAKK